MNRKNRISGTGFPAPVDYFLGTALHFGIAALDAVKIEVLGIGARGHGACGSPAQADAHSRASEHNHQGSGFERVLVRLIGTNVTDTAREHDGLVVTVAHIAHARFEGTEVPENIRASEFVIKGGRSDRTFGHHRQGRGNARRCPIYRSELTVSLLRRIAVVFPILRMAGNM